MVERMKTAKRIGKLYYFETFQYFSKFSSHHKRNEAWLLVISMVYMSCFTSCRTINASYLSKLGNVGKI